MMWLWSRSLPIAWWCDKSCEGLVKVLKAQVICERYLNQTNQTKHTKKQHVLEAVTFVKTLNPWVCYAFGNVPRTSNQPPSVIWIMRRTYTTRPHGSIHFLSFLPFTFCLCRVNFKSTQFEFGIKAFSCFLIWPSLSAAQQCCADARLKTKHCPSRQPLTSLSSCHHSWTDFTIALLPMRLSWQSFTMFFSVPFVNSRIGFQILKPAGFDEI